MSRNEPLARSLRGSRSASTRAISAFVGRRIVSRIGGVSARGVFLAGLVLVTVLLAASVYALSCTVTTSTLPNETLVMNLMNYSNAHGELPSETNYNYHLYCGDPNITLGTNCSSGANVLNLSNATNAHGSVIPNAYYTTHVCLSASGTGVTCGWTSGTVPANSTCLVTLANETNAHFSECSNPYSVKAYCSFADLGPPTWKNNATNETLTTPRYNESIQLNVTLDDDLALGSYTFSWNDSGSWVNSSTVPISGREYNLSLSKRVTRTRGQVIGWRVYFSDAAGNTNVTPAFTFTVKNTLPGAPVLDQLAQGANTYNRTPFFNWTGTDVDGDPLTYNLSITCLNGCSADDRNYSGIAQENFTVPTDLQFLYDDGYVYNWSVQACDPFGCGPWANERNFTISGLVSVYFSRNSTDFGNLAIGQNSSTVNDTPLPLEVTNAGNVLVNLTVFAVSSLFVTSPLPSSYFEIAARDQGSSNSYLSANTTFFPVPGQGSPARIVHALNYAAGNDTVPYDLYVKAPLDEPNGPKQATITTVAVRS